MKKLIVLLALVATMAAMCSADLIAHYEFEGNANNSADNNHGTLMSEATYEDSLIYGGKDFGQSLSLDGDGDYMICGATFSSVTAAQRKQ